MRLRIKIISFFVFTLFLGLFSAKTAFADTFTLSGKVTDGSNNPIANTTITVTDSSSQTIGTTTSDNNGNYTLAVPQGTYTISANPPSSSGFQSTSVTNQTINGDTIINFTLVSVPTFATVSGHVTDRTGAAISGATVFADSNNAGTHTAQTSTDSNGFYSLQVPSGSHAIGVEEVHAPSAYVPHDFFGVMMANPINFAQDKTIDMQIPGYAVTVHVQDPSNNPVANAFVDTVNSGSISVQTSLGALQFNAEPGNDPTTGGASGHTDSNGNVTVGSLPGSIQIDVTPPSGSNLLSFSTSKTITGDTTQDFSLQHQHEYQPPSISTITASASATQVNTPITASANFSDPDTSDTHTAKWEWGDGHTSTCPPNTSECTLTETNGSGTVTGSHTYTSAGVYTIKLIVTDNHGASGNATYQYLAVYVPTSSGLFTGVRQFDNPSGATPNTTGQVKFGISVKYDTNNQPTGMVSMNFNNANLDFKAT